MIKMKFLVAIVNLTLLTVLFCQPIDAKDGIRKLYGEGRQLYDDKKYEEAIERYNEALCKSQSGSSYYDEFYVNVKYQIALCYSNLAKDNKALEQLEEEKMKRLLRKIQTKRKDDEQIRELQNGITYLHGYVLFKQKKYTEAKTEFGKLTDKGTPPNLFQGEALYAIELIQYEEAKAQVGIANCYFKERNWAQAISEYQKVIDEYSKPINLISYATFQISEAYYQKKDYENALSFYQKVLENYPIYEEIPYALYGAFRSLRKLNRENEIITFGTPYYENARNTAEKFIEEQKGQTFEVAEMQMILGDIQFQMKYYQDAAATYAKVWDDYPDVPEFFLLKLRAKLQEGLSYFKDTKWQDAVTAYKEAIDNFSNETYNPANYNNYDFDERTRYIESCRLNQALCYENLEEWKKAKDSYQSILENEAISQDCKDRAAMKLAEILYGMVLSKRELAKSKKNGWLDVITTLDEAEEDITKFLQRFLNKQPKIKQVLKNIRDIRECEVIPKLLSEGDYREAESVFNREIERQRAFANTFTDILKKMKWQLKLGYLCLKDGKYDKAISEYEKVVIQMNPKPKEKELVRPYLEAQYQIAFCKYKLGKDTHDNNTALQYYNEAIYGYEMENGISFKIGGISDLIDNPDVDNSMLVNANQLRRSAYDGLADRYFKIGSDYMKQANLDLEHPDNWKQPFSPENENNVNEAIKAFDSFLEVTTKLNFTELDQTIDRILGIGIILAHLYSHKDNQSYDAINKMKAVRDKIRDSQASWQKKLEAQLWVWEFYLKHADAVRKINPTQCEEDLAQATFLYQDIHNMGKETTEAKEEQIKKQLLKTISSYEILARDYLKTRNFPKAAYIFQQIIHFFKNTPLAKVPLWRYNIVGCYLEMDKYQKVIEEIDKIKIDELTAHALYTKVTCCKKLMDGTPERTIKQTYLDKYEQALNTLEKQYPKSEYSKYYEQLRIYKQQIKKQLGD